MEARAHAAVETIREAVARALSMTDETTSIMRLAQMEKFGDALSVVALALNQITSSADKQDESTLFKYSLKHLGDLAKGDDMQVDAALAIKAHYNKRPDTVVSAVEDVEATLRCSLLGQYADEDEDEEGDSEDKKDTLTQIHADDRHYVYRRTADGRMEAVPESQETSLDVTVDDDDDEITVQCYSIPWVARHGTLNGMDAHPSEKLLATVQEAKVCIWNMEPILDDDCEMTDTKLLFTDECVERQNTPLDFGTEEPEEAAMEDDDVGDDTEDRRDIVQDRRVIGERRFLLNCVQWSPNGVMLAVGGSHDTLILYERPVGDKMPAPEEGGFYQDDSYEVDESRLKSWQRVAKLKVKGDNHVVALSWSPCSRLLAAVYARGEVAVFNVRNISNTMTQFARNPGNAAFERELKVFRRIGGFLPIATLSSQQWENVDSNCEALDRRFTEALADTHPQKREREEEEALASKPPVAIAWCPHGKLLAVASVARVVLLRLASREESRGMGRSTAFLRMVAGARIAKSLSEAARIESDRTLRHAKLAWTPDGKFLLAPFAAVEDCEIDGNVLDSIVTKEWNESLSAGHKLRVPPVEASPQHVEHGQLLAFAVRNSNPPTISVAWNAAPLPSRPHFVAVSPRFYDPQPEGGETIRVDKSPDKEKDKDQMDKDQMDKDRDTDKDQMDKHADQVDKEDADKAVLVEAFTEEDVRHTPVCYLYAVSCQSVARDIVIGTTDKRRAWSTFRNFGQKPVADMCWHRTGDFLFVAFEDGDLVAFQIIIPPTYPLGKFTLDWEKQYRKSRKLEEPRQVSLHEAATKLQRSSESPEASSLLGAPSVFNENDDDDDDAMEVPTRRKTPALPQPQGAVAAHAYAHAGSLPVAAQLAQPQVVPVPTQVTLRQVALLPSHDAAALVTDAAALLRRLPRLPFGLSRQAPGLLLRCDLDSHSLLEARLLRRDAGAGLTLADERFDDSDAEDLDDAVDDRVRADVRAYVRWRISLRDRRRNDVRWHVTLALPRGSAVTALCARAGSPVVVIGTRHGEVHVLCARSGHVVTAPLALACSAITRAHVQVVPPATDGDTDGRVAVALLTASGTLYTFVWTGSQLRRLLEPLSVTPVFSRAALLLDQTCEGGKGGTKGDTKGGGKEQTQEEEETPEGQERPRKRRKVSRASQLRIADVAFVAGSDGSLVPSLQVSAGDLDDHLQLSHDPFDCSKSARASCTMVWNVHAHSWQRALFAGECLDVVAREHIPLPGLPSANLMQRDTRKRLQAARLSHSAAAQLAPADDAQRLLSLLRLADGARDQEHLQDMLRRLLALLGRTRRRNAGGLVAALSDATLPAIFVAGSVTQWDRVRALLLVKTLRTVQMQRLMDEVSRGRSSGATRTDALAMFEDEVNQRVQQRWKYYEPRLVQVLQASLSNIPPAKPPASVASTTDAPSANAGNCDSLGTTTAAASSPDAADTATATAAVTKESSAGVLASSTNESSSNNNDNNDNDNNNNNNNNTKNSNSGPKATPLNIARSLSDSSI